MEKGFYDICYEVLSNYLHFPDVADTYKSIEDGLSYLENFPRSIVEFQKKKGEIISYIQTVRMGNIIDAYRENENMLLFVPSPLGKRLNQMSPEELYVDLRAEIPRLIFKGIHQTIKHLNIIESDNELTAELLQQNIVVLQKYGVLSV